MQTKCIGIISYLPSNPEIRKNRFEKLKILLNSCDSLFNLPTVIVAQEWSDSEVLEIEYKHPNCEICCYLNKLGIVGARNELRELFLNSNYDVLIMLDDDSTVNGDKNSANNYLKQIDDHPGCFYEFNLTLLKLFAISREVFELEIFDETLNPEDEIAFEDRIFVNRLRIKYPDKRYIFSKGNLSEHSISTADKNSTWYCGQNNKKMVAATLKIIEEMKNKIN